MAFFLEEERRGSNAADEGSGKTPSASPGLSEKKIAFGG